MSKDKKKQDKSEWSKGESIPDKKVSKSNTNDKLTLDLNVEKKNYTWEKNHRKIKKAFLDYIDEFHDVPTVSEVAKRTKITPHVVADHVNNIEFRPQSHPLRVLTDNIIVALAKRAMDGDQRSVDLWFKLFEGHKEKMLHAIEGKIELTGQLAIRHDVQTSISVVPLIDLVVSKICVAVGVHPKNILYKLHNSHYSTFSGIKSMPKEEDEVQYPSSVAYDFDKLQKLHNERKNNDNIEEAQIVENKKSLKDILMEKLKEKKEKKNDK